MDHRRASPGTGGPGAATLDPVPRHRAPLRRAVARLCRRLALTIRDAEDGDYPAIEALARLSFPVPDWQFRFPANRDHYRPGWARAAGPGRRRVRVAVDPGGHLHAYAYQALRPDGDLYLRELAAGPPRQPGRVRRAGTLLLADGIAAAGALVRRITLTVVEPHRVSSDAPPWRDPVGFYERLGFRIEPIERGYTADGGCPWPGDTWMTSRADAAARALLDELEGDLRTRPVEPCR